MQTQADIDAERRKAWQETIVKQADEALDLIHKMMLKIDNLNGYEGAKEVLGQDLYDKACHTIGWDVDWEKVHNNP